MKQVWNCCARLAGNAGPKKSPPGQHRTTLSGYVFANKARIDNQKKKLVKEQCLPHTHSRHGELRPTSGWDLLASLRHPCKFQRVSRLGSVTARYSSTGRHLYSAGRPSRWALAHILFMVALCNRADHYIFALWFLSIFFFFFLLFFPRLISAVGDWISTILLHMAWP